MDVIRSENLVRRVTADVADALRETVWRAADWDLICRKLSDALPGSIMTLVNYDLPNNTINTAFQYGTDPEYLESYRLYYASINPWRDFWSSQRPGEVRFSEHDSPAAAFQNTEFYVDWLARLKNADAAAGLRLDIDPHNVIHLAWHYDVAKAAEYDLAAEAILTALKPHIENAALGAEMLRTGLEAGLRLGALIERIDGAAFLLDRDRQIREANAEAVGALRSGVIVSGSGGVLMMRSPAAQRWLEESLPRLLGGDAADTGPVTFTIGESIVRATLTRAAEYADANMALLVRPRPQVLLVVDVLVGGITRMDVEGLRFAFNLSCAEIRLCEVLVNGHSLLEAAHMLGISEGTVRQRVKMVFHKTGTNRQGGLIALLGRFRVPG